MPTPFASRPLPQPITPRGRARRALAPLALAAAVLAGDGLAAVIEVFPTDPAAVSIAKIEGAGAGDEVIVAPGTYRFRLYLAAHGTPLQPIVIRAADPGNRPVWDLGGDFTADWPGTYTGGDRGRAIWQITGSHYDISGIVFRNGTDGGTGDGGGLRLKSSDAITIRDCLFQENDNGLQGAGTNTLVEFCEFDRNGLPGATDASHNVYMHGGDLTLRHSYVHDAQSGQNLHLRCNAVVIEYNWIARAVTYLGDLMPCTVAPCDADQYLTLRGNVLIHGTAPDAGQILVLYNDQGAAGKRFHLRLVNNTIVGSGDPAALVYLANGNPALNALQEAVLDNNVVYDVARIFRVDAPGLANWTAAGTANWVSAGTADTTGLTNTLTGSEPGFTDPGAMNYVPSPTSPLVGSADPGVPGLPEHEYFRDQDLPLRWRARSSAFDLGAFESTTAAAPAGARCPSGGAPLACDDANPCTDDACDADATCILAPNVEACDDGQPCTTADACDAGACTGTALPEGCPALDSFVVDQAKRSAPAFVKFGPALLEDAFGGRKYEIGNPTQLALPAAPDAGAITDPDTHLREHRVKPFGGAPRFERLQDVPVANPCNASLFLEVKKPVSLLVPAAMSLSDPDVPAPDPASHQVDHFLCYKAKAESALADGTALPRFPRGIQVELADALLARRYDLRKVTKLCLPVAAGEDPSDPSRLLAGSSQGAPRPIAAAARRHPERLLVCYQARLARKLIAQVDGPGGPGTGCGPLDPTSAGTAIPPQPKLVPVAGVHVNDQFGPEEVAVTKLKEICIPSH